MKLIISFIFVNLFIFITILSLLSAASSIIYDSTGNKLLRGIPYYILPLLRGSGGGLTLSQNTKDACPLNVTQESFEVNNGGPFTFNPIILDEEIIRGAYPVSIEADVVNPCHGSNIWKVTTATAAKDDDDDLLTNNKHKKKKDGDKEVISVQIVTTGGEFNKPESCFQVVEDDVMPGLQSYQIQHCPFKCGTTSTDLTCYNVGVVRDADGKGYLGRTDAIFPVVFTNSLRASSQLSAKVSTSIQPGKLMRSE
ncbi:unnamed protein product [Lactuca virosa]|uniref:Proteinase inhibitor I3 n=1 Tax=Lactuca virosa TaxID=75947 RepID=A0AAU9MU96_9ASTR|nr:unnamed protein product [Lactuca virosa]